jgi:hypothetical protein
MKSAYMIHEVVMNGERIAPNTVVTDLADETFAELEAAGAVREATEDEVLLAAPAAPAVDAKAAAKAAKKTAAKAAPDEAAAKAAEEAAKKDADPDVTEADLLGNT